MVHFFTYFSFFPIAFRLVLWLLLRVLRSPIVRKRTRFYLKKKNIFSFHSFLSTCVRVSLQFNTKLLINILMILKARHQFFCRTALHSVHVQAIHTHTRMHARCNNYYYYRFFPIAQWIAPWDTYKTFFGCISVLLVNFIIFQFCLCVHVQHIGFSTKHMVKTCLCSFELFWWVLF